MNRKQPKTFRQRLGSFIFGGDIIREERERFAEVLQDVAQASQEVWEPAPGFILESVKAALQEMDATQYYDLIAALEPTWAIGFGPGQEAERISTVARSRQAWRSDPVTQWIITTWTNFAFGENVQMSVVKTKTKTKPQEPQEQEPTPSDPQVEEAGAILGEFWTADRNHYVLAQDRLQRLSDTVLVDGELWLTFYVSTLDGLTTMRLIPTDEVTEIVSKKGDSIVPVYYKRFFQDTDNTQKTIYYLDWLAAIDTKGEGYPDLLPTGAIRAETVQTNTFVCMLHVAMNVKTGKRGWPLMTTGLPWSREHKRFREHRSSVAAAVAMFVQTLKVGGGSRATETMKNRLQSSMVNAGLIDTNPPAAAGSTFISNQQATLERLPLVTGASDAKTDGESLLLMAGLGGGLFPHWLGAGDAYRLATATAMEAPLLREFSRYQNFWASQFRAVARVVLWAMNTYKGTKIDYPSLVIDVSTDRLVEVDLVAISGAIKSLYDSTLIPLLQQGAINPQVVQDITAFVWLNAMQALGYPGTSDIVDPERFRPASRREPTPPTTPPTPPTNGNPPQEPPEEGDDLPLVGVHPDSVIGQIQEAYQAVIDSFSSLSTKPVRNISDGETGESLPASEPNE